MTTWLPIKTAPRDGRFILLAGPSGYTSTNLRVQACRYTEGYRSPWRTFSNDAFTDDGPEPTHWLPLPTDDDTDLLTYLGFKPSEQDVIKAFATEEEATVRVLLARALRFYHLHKVVGPDHIPVLPPTYVNSDRA